MGKGNKEKCTIEGDELDKHCFSGIRSACNSNPCKVYKIIMNERTKRRVLRISNAQADGRKLSLLDIWVITDKKNRINMETRIHRNGNIKTSPEVIK